MALKCHSFTPGGSERRKAKRPTSCPTSLAIRRIPAADERATPSATAPADPPQMGPSERNGATCVACNSGVPLEYVRSTSREVGLGAKLMAIVAEGNRRRIYIAAAENQIAAASRLCAPRTFLPENCSTGQDASTSIGTALPNSLTSSLTADSLPHSPPLPTSSMKPAKGFSPTPSQ